MLFIWFSALWGNSAIKPVLRQACSVRHKYKKDRETLETIRLYFNKFIKLNDSEWADFEKCI
ncbi:MAG: hypothetical protein MUE81_19750, partial [Thermoflexibacter sp.]|nr:hypothetical protein [Thermoflexibacter sp.]